jgi:metal-sulfur cluster biosynthetic enzyme
MITEADVRTILDEVIHPSFGLSLVALNMVAAVRVAGDEIEVDLVMNCPGCPAGEVALLRARQVLQSMNVSSQIRFSLLPQTWKPPWS